MICDHYQAAEVDQKLDKDLKMKDIHASLRISIILVFNRKLATKCKNIPAIWTLSYVYFLVDYRFFPASRVISVLSTVPPPPTPCLQAS